LFLEQYKLEANPFAADAARPVFASHSMRYAALKLEELIGKNIQSLFLSGPAGVGKGTLTRQRFRQLPDLTDDLLTLSGVAPCFVAHEPLASAADREALFVEQAADLANDQHVLALVVTTVAPAFHGLELRELLFPVA